MVGRKKKTDVILRCNKDGLKRYVRSQRNMVVSVGKDIEIVTPVK